MRPFRVGVLVSGSGTNLQAVLDSVHREEGIEVVCVAANRAEAEGLARAETAGVETAVFPVAEHATRTARDEALAEFLTAHEVDLVVLAGFMELLSPGFVGRFEGRMINVHPSLLPAFPGVRAIEQAIEYGVRVTGVTVHFVDEGVDTGSILLQEAIELPYAPDIERVEQTIHAAEHRLLPEAIRLIARGALREERGEAGKRRRIVIEGGRHGEH
ncbi:MAG: Phosphoribosylglycinamide formyltransferase [uncultured Solirubrobacterales bacterium]|uniref:Phosphoribosylglycinamide formyltransferase n=1 Tax=uncultured Solirubrobacterales bacterium TaxID=768556 RepID=A0A6J4SMI0_9ACTN|nr:MAG: Phosphoribosylglycinamide formyltransferase [uncultured Solirubrobacterales bacterium]